MPNWKKVITSGSNAALNNITASRLTLESSGSTIFDVVGSQGQLFSITDSLSGSLFAVSDISGLPILEVFSDDTVKIGSFNNEAIIVSGSNATITGSFTGSFTGDGSNLTGLPTQDPFPYTGDAIITGSNSNIDSASLAVANSDEEPLLSLTNNGTLTLGHNVANTTEGNLKLINRQGDSWMGGQNTWGNISSGILIQAEPTNTLYYRNLLFYVKSTQSSAAGVEKMRLDYSGNLGIGTTTPQERLHVAGNAVITGSNSLAGNYALKVTNTSGDDILNVENDGKTSLLTPTLNGTTIFSTGDTTLKITDGQSGNQRGPIFETFGDAGGWNGAYDFKTGYNGGATTTSAFKIIGRGSNGANTAVGIGNFGINILETNSSAQLVVEKHTMTTSNRNEAIRLLNNQSNVDASEDSTYSGIQFNSFSEGVKGGAFIGTQASTYSNGYETDFVILATGVSQTSYSEIARFVGWNKSLYVGEDRDVINSSYKLQVDGAVSASTYYGDGSNLTGISSDPFPYTGSAIISGSLDVTGSISVTGDITTNTISTISTLLASDSATNVDTFATATYTGAIYDYTLVDTTVGARAGQFMVAQDNGSITFTDTSTKHLFDPTIPEITAQINGSNVEVQVTNGNGYTFKAFTKKL